MSRVYFHIDLNAFFVYAGGNKLRKENHLLLVENPEEV